MAANGSACCATFEAHPGPVATGCDVITLHSKGWKGRRRRSEGAGQKREREVGFYRQMRPAAARLRSAWFVGVLVLMVYLIFAITLYLLPARLQ
jgi:hypothetical protein